MIPPDTLLYIYEIRGDQGVDLSGAPASFIGLWNESEFSYLFFSQPEDDYIRNDVCSYDLFLNGRHEILYRDWQSGLPSSGVTIGRVRFVSRDFLAPPPEAVLLDPSVVFGDGSHPTTVSCLRAMEKIVRSQSVYSLLDLGTGSGILALAAARMGIKYILGVDYNSLAVETARRNVEANSLSPVIRVEAGEARHFVDRPFDLVAANLPFHVLRELSVGNGVRRHRIWIVSGINEQQGALLKELFFEQGYELFYESEDPPWVTFAIVNNDARR